MERSGCAWLTRVEAEAVLAALEHEASVVRDGPIAPAPQRGGRQEAGAERRHGSGEGGALRAALGARRLRARLSPRARWAGGVSGRRRRPARQQRPQPVAQEAHCPCEQRPLPPPMVRVVNLAVIRMVGALLLLLIVNLGVRGQADAGGAEQRLRHGRGAVQQQRLLGGQVHGRPQPPHPQRPRRLLLTRRARDASDTATQCTRRNDSPPPPPPPGGRPAAAPWRPPATITTDVHHERGWGGDGRGGTEGGGTEGGGGADDHIIMGDGSEDPGCEESVSQSVSEEGARPGDALHAWWAAVGGAGRGAPAVCGPRSAATAPAPAHLSA
jgi:uncharacterized membrane protein YgcG